MGPAAGRLLTDQPFKRRKETNSVYRCINIYPALL